MIESQSWESSTATLQRNLLPFSGVVTKGGGGLQLPHGASNDVIVTSDTYFQVLDTLSLIIWFCNCGNNKNYAALFPEFCSCC